MKIAEKDAIIFDLGGVILNLNYQLTEDAFVALGLENFKTVYSQLAQTDLFDRFEKGEISGFHFINRLLDQLPTGTTANQVVHAWDAMILDFPLDRLEWLLQLKQERRIFLLSNTNALHIDAVRRALKKTVGHDRLEDFFETVYLSHEMGMRKPDPAIFLKVCELEGLNPATTVFIDDSPQHVEGARLAGLKSVFFDGNNDLILTLF
jgi:putative hydrolase of the HAD superfamily